MGEKYAVCNKSSTCVEQMYFIRNTFSFINFNLFFFIFIYMHTHTHILFRIWLKRI